MTLTLHPLRVSHSAISETQKRADLPEDDSGADELALDLYCSYFKHLCPALDEGRSTVEETLDVLQRIRRGYKRYAQDDIDRILRKWGR